MIPQATAAPTATPFPVLPTPTLQPEHSIGRNGSLVGVVVIASVVALAVIGAYVFIMNRGGFELAEEKLAKLFRRRRR